ncbi:hypothetical protein D920_02445 [Enterococcus faecalis 13-SD-W-01]|nr:hypothetical protein D920_02445 [Enterococcus faecalis 13-SD-W-01]
MQTSFIPVGNRKLQIIYFFKCAVFHKYFFFNDKQQQIKEFFWLIRLTVMYS